MYKEFFKVQLIRELINHVLLYTGIKRPGALAYSSTCQNFAWGDIKNYVLKMAHDVLGATKLKFVISKAMSFQESKTTLFFTKSHLKYAASFCLHSQEIAKN